MSQQADTVMNVFTGSNGPDNLYGTEYADTLVGYGGSDNLFGLGGKDILAPGVEAGVLDSVFGGDDSTSSATPVRPAPRSTSRPAVATANRPT
jgi:Ca2+-binding RTX toxin-like protein